LSVLASPALAFTGQGYSWKVPAGTPIEFRLHPDGAPGVGAASLPIIRRAFNTWQTVACTNLTFVDQPWEEPRVVSSDSRNRIFWSQLATEWPADQRATIALTYTYYRTADHAIVDADIFSNASTYQWTATDGGAGGTVVDLETVLFHEIGHFFGLAHSTDPGAAMFPSNNKPAQRGPATDDINGICSLYPNGTAPPTGNGTTPTGAGVGAPCQLTTDCAGRICVDDVALNTSYCSQECNTGVASTCPVGYECAPTSIGSLCVAPSPVDELCDQCSAAGQCSSGLCLNVPGKNNFQPFCTRACDPTPGAAGQCPEGYECGVVFDQGLQGGVCAPTGGLCNPKGRGGHGEPCFSNGTCKPQHLCVDFFEGGTGPYFCYYACPKELAGSSCSDTLPVVCTDLSGQAPGEAACINVASVSEPCAPEKCADGSICAWKETETIDAAVCFQLCNGANPCPANTQCIIDPGLGANTGYCQPNSGFLKLGAGCQSSAECESRSCKTYGNASLCTATCTETDPTSFPAGFVCIPNPGERNGFAWPRTVQDQSAVDPTRGITKRLPPAGFCACDTSNTCDPGCECDPECTGGCSCGVASASAPPWTGSDGIVLSLALIALALVTRRGRRAS